jgi:SHS2 domain-containing protein
MLQCLWWKGTNTIGMERDVQGSMSGETIEIVEHTADWSLRIRGADLGELFANAAKGMAMLMVEDPQVLGEDVERSLALEAYDVESLLVDWLNELAYLAEVEGIVFKEIELNEIGEKQLAATVRGGKAPVLDKHIKAVTFHNLAIQQTAIGLEVTIVFDV